MSLFTPIFLAAFLLGTNSQAEEDYASPSVAEANSRISRSSGEVNAGSAVLLRSSSGAAGDDGCTVRGEDPPKRCVTSSRPSSGGGGG